MHFSFCNAAHKNYFRLVLTGIFIMSDFHIVYVCKLYTKLHYITHGQVSCQVIYPL